MINSETTLAWIGANDLPGHTGPLVVLLDLQTHVERDHFIVEEKEQLAPRICQKINSSVGLIFCRHTYAVAVGMRRQDLNRTAVKKASTLRFSLHALAFSFTWPVLGSLMSRCSAV
jgi:hypothetical protein